MPKPQAKASSVRSRGDESGEDIHQAVGFGGSRFREV